MLGSVWKPVSGMDCYQATAIMLAPFNSSFVRRGIIPAVGILADMGEERKIYI